jgi:hypothetical protein
VVFYDKTKHVLSILRIEVWDSLQRRSQQESPREQTFDEKPVATQTPTPTPKRDCMVVATELYQRLVEANIWFSKILMFDVTENGKRITGHAVVVWKITPDGNVYAGDADGTLELDTNSEDAENILLALGLKYSHGESKVVLLGHFAK